MSMRARRLVLAFSVAVLGVLAFAGAAALAGAPEAPEATVQTPVSATTATLDGVLNPNGVGGPGTYELGTYEFLYKASGTECQGEGTAPASPGISLGEGKEKISEVLTDLAPDTEYTVCLLVRNEAGEATVGPAVTFTTAVAAPAIASESVANVEATAATLEAQVDPDGIATTYRFEYGPTEAYGASTPTSALTGADNVDQGASARINGLQPGSTYHYRVVASNPESPAGGTVGPDRTLRTPSAPGSAPTEVCPNEQLRAEQPYGLELPDCRAYEMVSPVEKNGNDATDPGNNLSRAAVSGEAIVFTSRGSFANPAGSELENQFLSRRTPEGWSTRSITPPVEVYNTHKLMPYANLAFTPELTEGIATTAAQLTGEAAAGQFELYLANFTGGSYQWVSKAALPPLIEYGPYASAINGPLYYPVGASTDLSHIVFFADQTGLFEWVDGEVVRVSVANGGEPMFANAGGGGGPYSTAAALGNSWNAVSSDGSRVFFTNPVEGGNEAQLYVRDSAERPQSGLASPEAHDTGTLAAGSNTVTEVAPERSSSSYARITAGSTEVTFRFTPVGFLVGELVSGPGIPAGATIAKVDGQTLTLSAPATESSPGEVPISSEYPLSFAVGQKVTGKGIPLGTTITAIAPHQLTLSAAAAEAGSAVALEAGGECTTSGDACTVKVSASQRTVPDPHGPQEALYWGASADGSRAFFTSRAELTDDAYTGPADNAANLYEYDLESGKLTDLTVDKADADGAAVQGVMQISEDGSYVYFVADGIPATGAVAGEPNLYVSHEGGAPTFIATLAAGDEREDWDAHSRDYFDGAAVSASGTHLAFVSEQSLTGYDNEPAEEGVEACAGRCKEVYLYNASTDSLACASCNPSGARPIGPSSLGEGDGEYDPEHRRRNFSEDGNRLFFQSYDALFPHDSNGRQDVYEYEDGRVYPVSDVAGEYNSYFMDASASGSDVFFATADQLVAQDQDNRIDVYDARVGGGFPTQVSLPPCDNGDSCKPPPAPQPGVFGAPASATFSGTGNLAAAVAVKSAAKAKAKPKQCKRGFAKQHGRCVKRKAKLKARRSSVHSEQKGKK
jgi:hypothetical protein